MAKKTNLFILAIVVAVIALQACSTFYFRSDYKNTNSLIHESANLQTKPFLKVHLKNGDICILKDTWRLDTTTQAIIGNGTLYNFNREIKSDGPLSIPVASVAILETNTKILSPESGRITALSILAGVDAIIGVLCLTNPKACFGSCPTFYLNENDNFHYADAEGFSNAIAPSMECADIDALNYKRITGDMFSITMKNEALETHCVNEVKLMAYPIKEGERVYQSPGNEFYRCENNYALNQASADEGDISALLRSQDSQERFSLSDKDNLSSKEEIYINFDKVKNTNNLGLIVNFRQSLMTTYFIYSAFGYMGDKVSDVFAKIENNNQTTGKLKEGIKKELGNIDVYLWDENTEKWEFQNGFYETGPIAINKQIIRLNKDSPGADIRLKLVLNKGYWRIDYLGLTNIKEIVKPIEISPCSILNKGVNDNLALAAINDPDKYVISMPGSEYKFNFKLPQQDVDYELFLFSKGYYLEWMRAHWLKDKNLLKLKQMVDNPKKYLRVEAGNYKRYEEVMEQEFWDSKIDTKTFSYYEN